VVLVSPRLQQGQRRGVDQHLAKAVCWLDQLQATLARGKQRRSRATLEAVLDERLEGSGRALTLTYTVDRTVLDRLQREWFGRLVLMTDQHEWSTADIIRTYRGQATVEGVFGRSTASHSPVTLLAIGAGNRHRMLFRPQC
jgi:hypothetical protein